MLDELEQKLSLLKNDSETTHGVKRAIFMLERELGLFKSHLTHKKSYPAPALKKLQIGGGPRLLDEFVNLDICEPADVVCDIREGIPFPDGVFELVFSEHFLEHIDYPVSVLKVIKEMYRVLSKGGQVIIGIPNAGLVAKNYASGNQEFLNELRERWYAKRDCNEFIQTPIDLVNYVFRDEEAHPIYNPHFWGYDFEKIQHLLLSAGFKNVQEWNVEEMAITNPKRHFSSLYVKASK